MSEWVFPDVREGDVVLWAESHTASTWHPAFVTKLGHDHISCAVLKHSTDGPFSPDGRTGVKHIDDPYWDTSDQRANLAHDVGFRGIFKTVDRLRELEDLLTDVKKLKSAASTPGRKGVKRDAIATG